MRAVRKRTLDLVKDPQSNAPCPCGSGKKFKRCHGLVMVDPLGYRRSDRESALQKLNRFTRRSEFEDDYEEAMGLFGADDVTDLIDHFDDEEVEALRHSPLLSLNAQVYFALDYPCEPGVTLIDLFLEREGALDKSARQLTEPEGRFLEDLRESQLRLYRILGLKSEQGLKLQRLWEDEDEEQGQILWVDDAELPDQLLLGDFVGLRLFQVPAGKLECFADVYPFPATAEEPVLAELEELRRAVSGQHAETSRAEYLRRYPYNLQRAWLYALFGDRMDQLEEEGLGEITGEASAETSINDGSPD